MNLIHTHSDGMRPAGTHFARMHLAHTHSDDMRSARVPSAYECPLSNPLTDLPLNKPLACEPSYQRTFGVPKLRRPTVRP